MPNRLAAETSPYLQQHANNPVDWYPWGPEALQRAADENKPILLSIGYSACHWCHVMERESFEDASLAAVMNASFVNVKVDREERPDLDEIYMKAVQAFQNGRGGWPMTVFLSPDGEPFFGGTYYPPSARDGMQGFDQLLERMAAMWNDKRDEVDDLRSRVKTMLADVSVLPSPASHIDHNWLEPVVLAVLERADPVHGGAKGTPKFPPHGALVALLAYGQSASHEPSLDAALLTLDRIGQGGMYDLLGGGFARYSVDEQWRVPHFEKMLYDNAQLLAAYTEGWRVNASPQYAEIVRRTVRWALEEMRLPGGAFAASQDADSEGHEGTFFVWSRNDLVRVLGEADAERFAAVAGVTETGTFEGGKSVLRLERPMHQLDRRERSLVTRCLPRLFRVRQQRVAPDRDDKVVTAWNGLLIRALARAGALFNEPAWIEAAAECARFLLHTVTVDGRLMRTYKDERAHIPAYADDHAALMLGLVDLYEATFDRSWLDHAVVMADALESLFAAPEGGLYTTGSDQPQLVVRSMQGLAGAEPSANGLAALALTRLAQLLERPDLLTRADAILRRLQPFLDDAPGALGLEAVAGAFRSARPCAVAVVGPPEHTEVLLHQARRFAPVFHVLSSGIDGAAMGLPWAADKPRTDVPTAYVCEGHTCLLPTTSADVLLQQLNDLVRAPTAHPIAIGARKPGPGLPIHPSRWLQANTPPTPADLGGQVVVLHFFAGAHLRGWTSIEQVRQVDAHFSERPVVVIGVASPRYPGEGDRRTVARAIGLHRIDHLILLDEDNELFDALSLSERPALLVLDAQGHIAWRSEGPLHAASTLIDLIDTLLAEGDTGRALPPPEITQIPSQPLAFPSRVHSFPDAMMQEMGADALNGGTLYVSDTGHHRILELGISQATTGWPCLTLQRTFGTGQPGFDDGDSPTFRLPHGVCRAGDTLYVADTGNHAIRKLNLNTGHTRTVAGTGKAGIRGPRGPQDWAHPLRVDLHAPLAVEVMDIRGEDLVFIAMAGSNQLWVYGDGNLGLFAGTGRLDHVDGPAAESSLAQPSGIALFGRYLLFTDAATHSVRGLDLQHHQAVTVVGLGVNDHGDVDAHGEAARMQYPLDLSFMGETLFVTDTLNHKIKQVSLSTIRVHTVAGGNPDQLAHPSGIDRIGRFLVIADTNNHRLRALDPKTGELRDLTWD